MEGQESSSGPLPEALEFEGRFMSSCPITDNPFWWHHEQSSREQQLPDFIPITYDIGASHQSQVGGARWSEERLNTYPSSSVSIKYESGDSSQQMGFQSTFSGVSSGSNNPPYQPTVGTYKDNSNESTTDNSINNVNQPVALESSVNELVTKDLLTNSVPSGQASTNFNGSSSANTSMNFRQTGIVFREENNRPASGVITTHSSDKRKSPEGYREESSAMTSKRSGQIAGSSGSLFCHMPSGSNSLPSSSANIYSLDSLGNLSYGSEPSPRSSFYEIHSQQGLSSNQNIGESTNTFIQSLGHTDILLPSTITNLATPPPQAVEEGSNVLNQSMTAQSQVTYQRGVHFVNGSRNITRNLSRLDFALGNAQMEETGFSNSTQGLQPPVIVPPVGPGNPAHITIDYGNSDGDTSIAVNTNLDTPSDPNLPVPTPNLISNSYRRRRLERIRQTLLEVFSEDSTVTHPGPGDHLGITPETRQRLVSQARHLITMYRGGRDISLLDDGVNARQSLVSALSSIRDQHRDMRLDVDNMSYEELLELGERIGDVKTGLSEEAIINSLKYTKFTFAINSNTPHAEPCSICREEYSEGEDVGSLGCGHEYHTNCIKQWLVLKNSCPICKAAAASSSSTK